MGTDARRVAECLASAIAGLSAAIMPRYDQPTLGGGGSGSGIGTSRRGLGLRRGDRSDPGSLDRSRLARQLVATSQRSRAP